MEFMKTKRDSITYTLPFSVAYNETVYDYSRFQKLLMGCNDREELDRIKDAVYATYANYVKELCQPIIALVDKRINQLENKTNSDSVNPESELQCAEIDESEEAYIVVKGNYTKIR